MVYALVKMRYDVDREKEKDKKIKNRESHVVNAKRESLIAMRVKNGKIGKY